jgi:uncharacterized protein (DUF1684 family)
MSTGFDESAWREQLQTSRAEKDEFFREDRRSPLSPSQQEAFDGLDYFSPDPDYRVAATVEVTDDPEPVELTVENGPPERFLRAVTFSFELPRDADDTEETREMSREETASGGETGSGGETVSESLCGYQRESGGDGLFVPFRDKTTGQETYRGGRYMDLHPDGALADGATVTVDFNLAYTPFCAFDDAFACPLPPEENWLSTTVPAGERTPDV